MNRPPNSYFKIISAQSATYMNKLFMKKKSLVSSDRKFPLSGSGKMRILWVPHTSWHIPQRAHLFCRALAERHEVHVSDWVADFSSLRDYFSLRYLQNFT